MFAGGGLGFTIGKEKQKDQNIEQVGSTVGSVKSSVDLEAQKDANIKGSRRILISSARRTNYR